MNICILDDNTADAIIIRETLNCLFKEETVIDLYKEYTRQINKSYDLYMIDIQLNHISGFEVAEEIKLAAPQAIIVFCSSHNNLVYDSFHYEPFYFVRKDHLQNDIEKMYTKFRRSIYSATAGYILKKEMMLINIPWLSIKYFEVHGNDMFINTFDGNEYKERKTMKELLTLVPETLFASPSHNCLVNLSYVKSMDSNELILVTGERISIVRGRFKSVRQKYIQYIAWR